MNRIVSPSPLVRCTLFAAVAALMFGASSDVASAKRGWDRQFNISFRGSGEPRDCSDLRVTSDAAVALAEETHSFAVSANPITLSASENGGLFVTGSSTAQIEVEVCKVALGSDDAAARANLARLDVQVGRAELSVRGASSHGDDDTAAFVIVRAPKGSVLALSTRNGPLSVEDFDGKLAIRGQNGPVSLSDVAGDISVDLENGPASLERGAGAIRIRTENGPISVELDGGEWQGAGLEAQAVNGPLSLDIAEDFRSGVRVESNGHSPWSCSSACKSGEKDWDDDRRSVTFGAAPYKVRLSTENGPISIGR
jgi:hypothetical protein